MAAAVVSGSHGNHLLLPSSSTFSTFWGASTTTSGPHQPWNSASTCATLFSVSPFLLPPTRFLFQLSYYLAQSHPLLGCHCVLLNSVGSQRNKRNEERTGTRDHGDQRGRWNVAEVATVAKLVFFFPPPPPPPPPPRSLSSPSLSLSLSLSACLPPSLSSSLSLSPLPDSPSRSSLVQVGYTQAARRRRGCSRFLCMNRCRQRVTGVANERCQCILRFSFLSSLPPPILRCLPPRKCLYSPPGFVPVTVHVSLLSACLP